VSNPKLEHVRLKKRAVDYFRANSEQYAERYSTPAQGDVLWQRHHAILALVAELGLPPDSRLLDLGCGPGLLSFDLAARGHHGVGLDAAPAMIGCAKRDAAARGFSSEWQYQVADVESLPFRDESFDGAICAGVIDYLPGDDNLLRETRRVLKPGGSFILAVTNKYGYTVSLSSVADQVKHSPRLMRFASDVRQRLIGGNHGVMSFDFVPRKHHPSAIRGALLKYGFRIERDRYVQFTLLPAPLCTLLSRLSPAGSSTLEALDRTPLRILGSCYILAGFKG
jgi:ubiquinone/menaquinone biosynthesis C-methylase UbiE